MSLTFLVVCSTLAVRGDQLYAPDLLWKRHIAEKTDPVAIADTHVGIPYRDDGTLDDRGYFTTFAHPDQVMDSPGLNCSGLVVSVARFLFNKNLTLQEVTRDRLGNSGPNSALGKDWDFGWDLIFNITDETQRRVIMPDGSHPSWEGTDGTTLRGFDLHDLAAWQRVLGQMQPGKVYLATISKPLHDRGYQLVHYHVAIMVPDSKGAVWLYHATRRSSVHRINMTTQQGMNRFMGEFRNSRGETKKILVVESVLPDLTETETAGDKQAPPPGDTAARDPRSATDVPLTPPPTAPPVTPLVPPGRQQAQAEAPTPPIAPLATTGVEAGPLLVLNHLSGRVLESLPDMVTSVPRLSDSGKGGLVFWFRNWGEKAKELQIVLKTPSGGAQYNGSLPGRGGILSVLYPRDFGVSHPVPVAEGRYLSNLWIDGGQWVSDLFEVATPREALPQIIAVRIPQTVQAGKTFTVSVEAQNRGAESDYGGITLSCPDPSGLKVVSASPGRVFPAGSTVLAVTTDKIRTKVPMAERWIELWGENNTYDLKVQLRAGKPGTYPVYVRCAIRGVNVKSSVILMDPASSEAVDQQGFPVKVYQVTVK